jgi:hypothetical protein
LYVTIAPVTVDVGVRADFAQDERLSLNTVFSTGSPINNENDSQEQSTLAAFVAHIERLQDEVRLKDARISNLEGDKEQLRQRHNQLAQEHNAINLQLDIQNQLLRKAKKTEIHIEQLRTGIIERDAIIGDKEKKIRAIERQLEQHKLLLQAEIRRHAKMTLHSGVEADPLPDLNTLAAQEDIDRWIVRLQEQVKQAKKFDNQGSLDLFQAQANDLQDLQQEIDFYVREILYYKLDVRGYKSDIKKLKKFTAQLGIYGSKASDVESDTSSLRTTVTPSQMHFAAITPDAAGHPLATVSANGPLTPPSSTGISPVDTSKPAVRYNLIQELSMEASVAPLVLNKKGGLKTATASNPINMEVSPRSHFNMGPSSGPKKSAVGETVPGKLHVL